MTAPAIDHYRARFDAFTAAADGALQPLRRAAFDRLAAAGFPTSSMEEWRGTPVASLLKHPFTPATRPERFPTIADVRALTGLPQPTHGIVFVNGAPEPSLSTTGTLPDGVVIESLGEARVAGHITDDALVEPAHTRTIFAALNTAFLHDGIVIHLPRRAVIAEPVHLVFLTAAGTGAPMTAPRIVVHLEAESSLTLIEHHASLDAGMHFTNAVTTVNAGQAAQFEHHRVQVENTAAFHVSNLVLHAQRDARIASHTFSFGGAFVRNDTVAVLDGEDIECTINGLTMADGGQHVEHQTLIDHAHPHCTSHELFKNILTGSAHGAFTGRIIVRPHAQKTDAKQSNSTLLLSDAATIDAKPQLEIFADDVRCTHGATIGRIDEEALFYLRTRGIGLAEATVVLTHAFASDLLRHVTPPDLAQALEHRIHTRF